VNASRERTAHLSRAEIARTALAMVDGDGIEHFSMRRLAEALGVTTMAVYHHFDNKAEVLQAAADQVWIEAALALEDHDDPVEDIAGSMLVVRRTFLAHPDLTTFAIAPPATEEAIHLTALAITQRFERAGFRGTDVGLAYHVLATYALGSALLDAERRILDRAIRRPVSDLADLGPESPQVPRGSKKAYRSVRDAMEDDPDLVRFERGLREITEGLFARHVWR
jgi:TetR/AcrR family tetracycline transcriptional repressor